METLAFTHQTLQHQIVDPDDPFFSSPNPWEHKLNPKLLLTWGLTALIFTSQATIATAQQQLFRLQDSGPTVTIIQQALAIQGFSVPVTGIFDLSTDEAVRAFQASRGLEVDGIVGPATSSVLGIDLPSISSTGGFASSTSAPTTFIPRTSIPTTSINPASAPGSFANSAPVPAEFISQAYPYVVAIPESNNTVLADVRQFLPNAFLAGSRRGPYVYAGAFLRRDQAEQIAQQLRTQGLDARVVFRPR
jgi:hypothetical protein